jgi:DHA2 family multidrug resistance protein
LSSSTSKVDHLEVADDAQEQSAQAHKWLVAVAVMLGPVLQGLDMSIINVALPYMQKSFNVGVERIAWVVTSYLVALSITVPLTGWIATRVGRKRYFLYSVLTFVAASALCGVAQGIGEMVIFRVLQGAAGAAMMPLSQAILLETFPPEEHTLAMSTFSMGTMVAPVVGPTLGGWITINLNWRWNFYINVPTGILAALLVYSFVHDPPYLRRQAGRGRVDYPGIILVALALGLFQIVLGRGGQDHWFRAPWVCWFSALSLISLVLLVFHELRFSEPVLDLRILKIFGFTLAVLMISVQAMVIFAINLLNPLFMETLLHFDAWQAGLAVAPRGLGVIVALLVVGQLSRRSFDLRPLVVVGYVVGAWEVWTMAHWGTHATMTALVMPIFIFGVALGAIFPTLTAISIGQVPRERMGYATSLYNVINNTGAATGVAVVTYLLTVRHQTHLARLAAPFHKFDPAVSSSAAGHVPAAHLVNTGLGAQAWLFAYNDMYKGLAILVLCLAPWALFLRRPGGDVDTSVVME